MIRQYDYLFKVVLVGNSSVGKSSLLRRFADDSFQESYLATIGVDFRFKQFWGIYRSITVQGNVVKLQIWDTAGQQRFRTITGAYYKGAHAIIVIYDITKKQSFEDIENFWLGEIQKYAAPNVQICVLGNKVDCEEESRKVSKEEVEEFCKAKGMKFFQVSAKNGVSVSQSFQQVSESLTKIYPKEERTPQHNTVVEDIKKKRQDFHLQSGGKQTKGKKKECCKN